MFYKIVVEGELTERFAGAFAGMTLEAESGQTIITGQIVDQSHLYGLLDHIRSMGLQLVGVQALPEYARGEDDSALADPRKNREIRRRYERPSPSAHRPGSRGRNRASLAPPRHFLGLSKVSTPCHRPRERILRYLRGDGCRRAHSLLRSGGLRAPKYERR